jgi:two-component system chemotaxis response regulator CheB
MIPGKKIRVVVVDDSAVARRALTELLSGPEIEIVGTARDPYEARDMIIQLQPDVLTLDVEMPRMDGITFLRILEKHHPLPVIVISALTQQGSQAALDALEAGAVDVVAKPHFVREHLIEQIKSAAAARRTRNPLAPVLANSSQNLKSDSISYHPRQVILMGASTGGTEALKYLLPQLPAGLPGICIVQHIPPQFSKAFADRMNDLCSFEVREAVPGDVVKPGLALVAPGNFHMTLAWERDHYRVALDQQPPLHFVRPAVDHLFASAAACAGKHAVGVLLTGMGCDGASGMQKLRQAGALNIAQNEASCVVYGMPRAAVELGVVDHLLALEKIPAAILNAVNSRARGKSPENGLASSTT